MKTLKQTVLVLTLSLIAVAPVFAGHAESHAARHSGLSERMEHQQQRIHQGIKRKELTRKEAKVLKREQRKISQLSKVFYDDGRLSKAERRVLKERLDENSRLIERLRHNDKTRYVRYHDAYAHRDHHRL